MAQVNSSAGHLTVTRSICVKELLQKVFCKACQHLSQLNDRSIEGYCKANNIPQYKANFFTEFEKKLIASKSFDNFEVKLSYKFLKICCGLKNDKDPIWTPAQNQNMPNDQKDTLEYLIGYCWNEYVQVLQDSASLSDNVVDDHCDKVLEALVMFVEKIEDLKYVDEAPLKSELKNQIERKFDTFNCSPVQLKYIILSEHLVHQILVLVYNHLNHLHGMSLSNFLNKNRFNLVPRTGFSNERKFLDGNPDPGKMPVNMLYQVVKRVCFSFKIRRTSPREPLLQILHDVKNEYKTPLRNDEDYSEKCYKLYEMLTSAFHKLCEETGKTMEQIIGKLATEAFIANHIQDPHELPESSPKKCDPPKEPSPPTTAAGPTLTSSVAKKGNGDLSTEEVNICVLRRLFSPGGMISQTLTKVYKALEGNFNVILEDKNSFITHLMSDEKKFIEKLKKSGSAPIEEEIAEKDIPFLCKLFRYGCQSLSKDDNAWSVTKINPNKDTIEYRLAVIKKERNTLCHERRSIKSEELEVILSDVKDSLHIIMHNAKRLLEDRKDCDMSNTIAEVQKHQDEMENKIQELHQMSYDLSYHNKWADMLNIRDKMKEAAKTDLMKSHVNGESMKSLSPITGSTDSRHKSLTIQAVFMDRQFQGNINAGVKDSYNIEDLFCNTSKLDSFRVVIIHGRPGDGKTSICKYVFQLWSQNINTSLTGVDLLFYIPCRNVTAKSLCEYLRGKLPTALKNAINEDIIPFLQDAQVLFVIDGYDEGREEAKNLIIEILTSLPDSKMIITTKSQWAPKLIDRVQGMNLSYKVLGIVELGEEERKEYVKKFFNAMKRNTEDCNDFLSYLDKMKEDLDTLIHVPLTLSLLALLWIEEPGKAKKIKTLAQLYNKLIGLIIKRIATQINQETLCISDWVIGLGEIAWNNLKKNKRHLDEEDQNSLWKKAKEMNLDSNAYQYMMTSLLHCEIHGSLLTEGEKVWTFTYSSQQEYFAAQYIVDEITCNKGASLRLILELSKTINEKQMKKLQRLIPVIEFICGLLVIKEKITERVEEITEIMAVKEPWAFISLEKTFKHLVQDNPQVRRVVKGMFMKEKMSIFYNYNFESILWVLNNTCLTLEEKVTVMSSMKDLPQTEPLLNYLLSKSRKTKVIVDIDEVSNISKLIQLTGDEKYEDITFFIVPWKPLCISEVIVAWPFNSPLHLSLCPEAFPLVWWKLLLCLLTMNKKVSKMVCNPVDPKRLKLIEDGVKNLKAELSKDFDLEPTEIIIHVEPSQCSSSSSSS